MEEGTLKIFLTLILMNILFPVFAIALTDPLQETEALDTYDLALDSDDLILAGISFEDASSHNVTFRGGPVYFNISGKRLRVNWRQLVPGDYFRFSTPSIVEYGYGELTGNYWLFGGRPLKLIYIDGKAHVGSEPSNSSIIAGFNTEFNWTRIDLWSRGQSVFITAIPPDYPNITKSIQETGIVTFTVAKLQDEAGEVSFIEFIDWYWGVLRGPEFGFPAAMAWLARILMLINMLVGIIVLRDFLGP